MSAKRLGPRQKCSAPGCNNASERRLAAGPCHRHQPGYMASLKRKAPEVDIYCWCGEPAAVADWALCSHHARQKVTADEKARHKRSSAALALSQPVCAHANVRAYRSTPPTYRCLDCQRQVRHVWVTGRIRGKS